MVSNIQFDSRKCLDASIDDQRQFRHPATLPCACIGRSRGGGGQAPGKSQECIFFLRNAGMDPLEKQLGSNCFSRLVRKALVKSDD